MQQHAGFELGDVLIDARRRRHIAGAEISAERLTVDGGGKLGQRGERLQLRGEHDASVGVAPIERLDAEPVAPKGDCARGFVEHREGEHADQALDRRAHAPSGEALHQHLGVGVAPEDVTLLLQLGAQLAGVIDLAVIGEDEAARRRQHRLGAGGAQIDDRQPRMAQRDAGLRVHPHAAGIRTAMVQRARHAGGERAQRVVARPPFGIEKPRNSAHLLGSCPTRHHG